MSVTKTLRTPVDSWIIESAPGQTKIYSHILRVNGGASQGRRAFIFFPNLILDNKYTVESATLYFYAEDDISGGPHTFRVRRITSRWKANAVTWNNQPTTTATHEATATVLSTLGAGAELSFDVTAILNDMVSGGTFYGFRFVGDSTGNFDFSSAQTTKAQKKPRLVVVYSRTPDAPTDLRPSGGDAIGSRQPALAWSSDVNQLQFQVQISTDKTAFVANIEHDSSATTQERQIYRLDEAAYFLPSNGDMRYWRVRVKNHAGIWSDYSSIVGMYYAAHGTLTITNPGLGGPVEETTPPIDWTFSGQTQEAYMVTLFDLGQVVEGVVFAGWGDDWGLRYGGAGWQQIWTSGWQKSNDTRVTIPPHKITRLNGSYYKVEVRVRDTIDRTSSPGTPPYVVAERVFTFAESATPSPISSLAVTNPEGWYIQLEWVDPTQPDFIGIKVDGEYIHDREDPDKYQVGATTTYRKKFYGARPLRLSEYEVVRIVKNGTGVYQHSQHSANHPQNFRFIPLGVWIVDPENDDAVNIGAGGSEVTVDLRVGESATTYYPLGRRDPIRIVDAVRGLEGTVGGFIRGLTNKEKFERFKAQLPHKQFRLITGDLSIRVRLGEVTTFFPMGNPVRNNDPSDKLWKVAVEVFQSDDWTFMARY